VNIRNPLLVAYTLLAGIHTAPARAQEAAGEYRLLKESRLEVATGKAGLFGFAGHEHIIRATAFAGEVRFTPDDPRATTIRIRILTDGLEVLTPPDTSEIRKVTASMRDEVMDVTQYPEISFVSKSVTPEADGYRVVAELTMHGQTREVQIFVRAEVRGDTLTARSRFALKQTDFGIRPYRGGPAGTVRVADKVEFRIDAVAIRRED